MEDFLFESKVMWSQIDANQHLRHSAYADFCAQARMEMLDKYGFSVNELQKFRIGPVLFREELIYLREIKAGEQIVVKTALTKLNSDASKWSFQQLLFNGKGAKSAIVNVDGAWIDLDKRKLTGLPDALKLLFDALPKISNFFQEGE